MENVKKTMRRSPNSRRLRFEPLESRNMLSASPFLPVINEPQFEVPVFSNNLTVSQLQNDAQLDFWGNLRYFASTEVLSRASIQESSVIQGVWESIEDTRVLWIANSYKFTYTKPTALNGYVLEDLPQYDFSFKVELVQNRQNSTLS